MRWVIGSVVAFALLTGCPKSAEPPKDAGAVVRTSSTAKTATTASAGEAHEDHDDHEAADPSVVHRPAFVSTADLGEVRKRKLLRVLVHGVGERFLPRKGRPAAHDRELAIDLASHLGVEIQFIAVEKWGDLIPALLAGKGDIIAAQMTVTEARSQKVAFTRPTVSVAEVVVGKKGQPGLPTKVEELAGKKVHVRKSSSYATTVAELAKEKAPGLTIVPVEESKDTETIVYEVAKGKRPLTIADSHILDSIEGYNPDIQRLFPVVEGQGIAWALRNNNPKLRAAANAVISENAMTAHTNEIFKGDLDGIKKRKVLRVLTRNNAVSYFLHRGQQFGFDYELAKMMAKKLGLRLEIVVPPKFEDLMDWLLMGKGDIIAAAMTVTPERSSKIAFSTRYLEIQELLVQKNGGALKTVEDLAGQKVYVRPSSSYARSLEILKPKFKGLTIVPVDETLETEAILDQVHDGKIPLTVADSNIVDMIRAYHADIQPLGSLDSVGAPKVQIAFGVRPDAPQTKAFLDAFVKEVYRGIEYNLARKKYFKNPRSVRIARERRANKSGQISPYDALIKKYATRYGFDWRLLAAQAYAESRFDPKVKSWVGAKGLFQVMPRTGASMGFHDLDNVEQGVHAGIKYMDRMVKRFDPKIDFRQRVRFALAAYNAGLGHVIDARRLAAEKGWNQDRWFGNVEKAMLLLKQPEYARRARHGYCRGTEPVRYVSKIQSWYDAYTKVVPH